MHRYEKPEGDSTKKYSLYLLSNKKQKHQRDKMHCNSTIKKYVIAALKP